MFNIIRLFSIIVYLTTNISYAKETSIIDSVSSLNLFVDKAISKGVIPNKIVFLDPRSGAKFQKIDFKYREQMKWGIDSICPVFKDEIIDASKGINHSIVCERGNTIILAGQGDDWVHDTFGNDVIYAGDGNDIIDAGDEGSDILVFEKGWGHDVVSINGVEIIPETIIGNDKKYHWKYSSFIVFGKGIKPKDIEWNNNILKNAKMGDTINFHGNMKFNLVFMDAPSTVLEPYKPIDFDWHVQHCESMEIYGNYLFLNSGSRGIDIINIENLEHPIITSHIDVPGTVITTKYYNGLLFVAQGDMYMKDKRGWLSVIDVKKMDTPRIISTLEYSSCIYDFILHNDLLIINESNSFYDDATIHFIQLKNLIEINKIPLKIHINQMDLLANDQLLLLASKSNQAYFYAIKDVKNVKQTKVENIKKIKQIQKNNKYKASLIEDNDEIYIELNTNSMSYKIKIVNKPLHNELFYILKDDHIYVIEGDGGIYDYILTENGPILKKIINIDGKFIEKFSMWNNKILALDTEGNIIIKAMEEEQEESIPQENLIESNPKSKKRIDNVSISVLLPFASNQRVFSKDQLLTLLHEASLNNDSLKIKELAGKGVALDKMGHMLILPLEIAAEHGNNDAVKALLELGVNPNQNKGRSIILASIYGHGETLRLLARFGGKMDSQDEFDQCTPLHYIARDGDIESAKFLISHGAKIDAKCFENEMPIDWARKAEQNNMIDWAKKEKQNNMVEYLQNIRL